MNKQKYIILKTMYTILRNKEKIMKLTIQNLRDNGAIIGENLRLFSRIPTPEPYLLEIGNNVTISTNVTFLTHDNSIIKIIDGKTDVFGKIIIRDNCFIGANVVLLPGIELGGNTIVGAGSVVTKSFREGNIIICGNPAKRIKAISDYKISIEGKAFNISGLKRNKVKQLILGNPDKLIKK